MGQIEFMSWVTMCWN